MAHKKTFFEIMFTPGVTAYQKAVLLDEVAEEFERIGLTNAVRRGNRLALSMYDTAFEERVEAVRKGQRQIPTTPPEVLIEP